jgi:hypothetical protein
VPLVQALRLHRDPNALFQQFARVALLDADTRLNEEYAAGHNDAGELCMDVVRELRDDGGVQAALGPLNPFGLSRFRVVEELHCNRGVGAAKCDGAWSTRRRGKNRFDDMISLSVQDVARNSDVVRSCIENTRPEEVPTVRCRSCQQTGSVTRCFRYTSCPTLLIIDLKRWSSHRKSNKQVAVPALAHVDALGSDYAFVGAACHHGSSLRAGHWDVIGSRGSPPVWYRFNDDEVTVVDLDSVLQSAVFCSSVTFVMFKRVGEQHVAPMAVDSDDDDDDGDGDVEMKDPPKLHRRS